MSRAHSKAAIIGRADADPLFIVHLADKQQIEANTRVEGMGKGARGGDRREEGAHGYCHVTKSWRIVNAMHV